MEEWERIASKNAVTTTAYKCLKTHYAVHTAIRVQYIPQEKGETETVQPSTTEREEARKKKEIKLFQFVILFSIAATAAVTFAILVLCVRFHLASH